MKRLVLAALAALAIGCQEPSEGVEAIQQGLGAYANLREHVRINYGITTAFDRAVWDKISSQAGPFYALSSSNIVGILYTLNAAHTAWVTTGIQYNNPVQSGSGTVLTPAAYYCVVFFSCSVIQRQMLSYTEFEIDLGFARASSPGGQVKMLYLYKYNGVTSGVPLGWGATYDVATMPDNSPGNPWTIANFDGVLRDPFGWSLISSNLGLSTGWYSSLEVCSCNSPGHADDRCQSWPQQGTCNNSDCYSICP